MLERRSAGELDPQVRRSRLLEAARLYEGQGDLPAAVAALQQLRAADDEDLDALKELGRLHEALGQAPELTAVLAERARLTEDPRQRAALWSRVGELRLTLLSDLDGAAEAYREALDGAPDDVLALSALESIEDRRGDWSTLQEVLLRRLGNSSGADQVAVLAEAGAQRRAEALRRRSGGRVPAPAARRRSGQWLRLPRARADPARLGALVRSRRRARQARGHRGGSRTQAVGARVAGGDRQRLGEGSRFAGERDRGAGEGVGGGARQRRRAAVPGPRPRAERALGRRERGRSSGRRRTRTSRRRSRRFTSATRTILRSKEADPAEIEAALLRAVDADAGHRPTLEALERLARDAKDDERLANILDLQLHTAADDDERGRLLREIAGLYSGALAQPTAALPYLERLVALDPTEIPGREQLAEALLAAGRTDAGHPHHRRGDRRADQSAAREGHCALADAARHDRRGARRHRRRRPPASTPPTSSTRAIRRRSPRWAASPTGAATSRPPASSTARCCCRTSTTRRRGSRSQRST